MKFVILSQYFQPEIGAAPTRLAAMIREIRALGHDVEVVTALPNYPTGKIFPEYRGHFYDRSVSGGMTIHRLWVYATVQGGLRRLLNYLSFTVTCVLGLLRVQRPDFLFVESPPIFLSVPAYLYSLMRGVPFIFNVADLWPDTIVDMGLLKPGLVLRILQGLERWSYRRASFVNAITEGIRDSLANIKKVPAEKILFLPNGVDTERYQPGPRDRGLLEQLGLAGKQIVLYAGTLGMAHGLENVLKAAELLRDRSEIHFLFLGDGSERVPLEKLRDDLGLKNVTFHDFVPLAQLAPFYSIAACGLASLRDIPIFETARPSKIFAVMASGKPMIYFGKGEGARLVVQADAGIAVPPEDPAALAHSVTQLLGDAATLERFGKNGRRFVEQHYQWSALVAQWVASLPQSGKLAAPVRAETTLS